MIQERLVRLSGIRTTGYASTYPSLSTVRIRALAINSTTPRSTDLRASWMSEDGHYLAPSPLRNGSFAFYATSVGGKAVHRPSVQERIDNDHQPLALKAGRRFDRGAGG